MDLPEQSSPLTRPRLRDSRTKCMVRCIIVPSRPCLALHADLRTESIKSRKNDRNQINEMLQVIKSTLSRITLPVDPKQRRVRHTTNKFRGRRWRGKMLLLRGEIQSWGRHRVGRSPCCGEICHRDSARMDSHYINSIIFYYKILNVISLW